MERELLYAQLKDLSIEKCTYMHKDASIHLRSELIANSGKNLYGVDYHLVLDLAYKVCFFQVSFLSGTSSEEIVGYRLSDHWVIDNLANLTIPKGIVVDVELSGLTMNFILKACDLQIGQSKAIEVLCINPKVLQIDLCKHTYHRIGLSSYLMQTSPMDPWIAIELDANGYIEQVADKYIQIPNKKSNLD